MWKHYAQSLAHAIVGLEEFPGLMLLHLQSNYPRYRWRREMLDRAKEGWLRRSMLVTAWQSAGSAVEVC